MSDIVSNSEVNERIRGYAAAALGSIGHSDGIAALLVALDDQHEDVWRAAAIALGRIGPAAKQAVGPLLKRLKAKDGSESTRQDVIEALKRIDAEAAAQAEVE